MTAVDLDARGTCVYCLDNQILSERQILLRGTSSYICAPRGQLVEGYLAIATYDCIGAITLLDGSARDEIEAFRDLIAEFYHEAYGITNPLFYEQARGGGGEHVDHVDRFPFHAHFCGLPVSVDVHSLLGTRFAGTSIATLHALDDVAAGSPYAYVDGIGSRGNRERIAYVPDTPEAVAELVRLRLKPPLAELLGLDDRADWRVYPGDDELENVIERFELFQRNRGGRCGGSTGRS